MIFTWSVFIFKCIKQSKSWHWRTIVKMPLFIVDENVVDAAAVLYTIKPILPIFREYRIQNEENEGCPSHHERMNERNIWWAAAVGQTEDSRQAGAVVKWRAQPSSSHSLAGIQSTPISGDAARFSQRYEWDHFNSFMWVPLKER